MAERVDGDSISWPISKDITNTPQGRSFIAELLINTDIETNAENLFDKILGIEEKEKKEKEKVEKFSFNDCDKHKRMAGIFRSEDGKTWRKVCSKCEKEKNLRQFLRKTNPYTDGCDQWKNICRECYSKHNKKKGWAETDSGKVAEYQEKRFQAKIYGKLRW